MIFFISACSVFAQQREIVLKGKTIVDGLGISNIQVMNLVTEKVTATNSNGEFQISAKEDDLIIFSSPSYEYKRHIVDSDDIAKGYFEVKLISKPIELEEVVVNKDINPEDLGIVPKGQKKYTVAERRLKQAGEFKPEMFVGMVAGLSIPIDPIINAITGRTTMLKKDLKTEKKERNLKKLKSLYQQKYFTDNLKIPADYVEGFQYYAIDDANAVAALDAGVKARLDFCLVALAQKYNELHAFETK
ncbi:hypothetical protein HUK80_12365 [Flavobacterium sp. MAH-1]|uniref:CarboxypepD_reg-like domain-containing protein n=1 Tax=Flavobacterium agri TaxID=2743471 RepID=A0A7Y9C7S3_9FLAO|nr:hypothetical protein [Flavobacterium agri]NUY81694.1 hypothetical protein [Flavobacterium agri]NYA71718.1 hypothetical protein [Flavobacterium agri]